MAKNETEKNNTVADVVAEAEAANLLHEEKSVPKQAVSLDASDVQRDSIDEKGCDEVDSPKKSFGVRLKSLTEKLKANRKGVIITLAVVGAATVAVAKFAAKTVVEEVVENVSEDLTEEEKKSIVDDIAASDIGG
jgi:hypothetical protein